MVPVFIVVGLCVSYFALALLFAFFFENRMPQFTGRAVMSVCIIAFCATLAFILAAVIPDTEFGNRIQHAFGGGFVTYLICYLAVRDSNVRVDRLHFAIFALLIVTAMGVANELLEFFLQTHTAGVFADNPLDTWRDLASNSVGALIAACVFLMPAKHS